MTSEEILNVLRRQEAMLILPHFDEETAFQIGSALQARAALQSAAVVIDIRSPSRRFYFAALPGSVPDYDDWARRKANVVLRCHKSSMQVGLQLYVDGRSQWPDAAMDMKDFAVHGGAFPVRVKGCGVVASIAVSGLPSREDHDMIICVLRDHLGLNDVPPTP